jgi:hypothetical protein
MKIQPMLFLFTFSALPKTKWFFKVCLDLKTFFPCTITGQDIPSNKKGNIASTFSNKHFFEGLRIGLKSIRRGFGGVNV